MGNLKDNCIANLLPPSLKGDPFIVALAEASEIEVKSAYREAEQLVNFFDVDQLPEYLLDYLAYQKHVDFYDTALPIEQKRELIKKADYFHRLKGTPAAVEGLISILFGQGRILEWFEYDGEPYHFKIRTNNYTVMGNQTEKFIKSLESVKNLRSKLDAVEYEQIYNQAIEIMFKYARYNYPFTIFCGNYITGTGPDGPSTLGRLVEQSMEISRPTYYNHPVDYHFTGRLVAGKETEVEQLQVNAETIIQMSRNYRSNIKSYNVCGDFYCGTEVTV